MSIFLWVCKDASRNAYCCYWKIAIASCVSDDVISSVGENTSRYLSLTSSKSFLTLLHATFRAALSAFSSGVMWNSHSSFDEDSSSIFANITLVISNATSSESMPCRYMALWHRRKVSLRSTGGINSDLMRVIPVINEDLDRGYQELYQHVEIALFIYSIYRLGLQSFLVYGYRVKCRNSRFFFVGLYS